MVFLLSWSGAECVSELALVSGSVCVSLTDPFTLQHGPSRRNGKRELKT